MAAKKTPKSRRGDTSAKRTTPERTHTTVRIDVDTHGRLMKISEETGKSLGQVISEGAAVIEQQRFIRQLRADYRRMRENSEEWESYVRERDQWLLGVPKLREDEK